MKKSFLFQILIFLPCCIIAQIGIKVKTNTISGTWVNQSAGFQMTLILNQDGSGKFDGESIKYTAVNNKLKISTPEFNQTNEYNFTLKDNSLSLSGGDLDAPILFTRSGAASNQSITEIPSNKKIDNPSHNPVDKTDLSIQGIWSGYGESIEFKDNQCIYLGQTYGYTLRDGNCILKTPQGELPMAYSINGNTLTLGINGKTLVYNKGNPSNLNNPTANTGKRIAPELVGKWCYVSVNSYNSGNSSIDQCINLNADGSYTYSGETSRSVNTNIVIGGTVSQGNDRGTWSYDGDRIYYVSIAGAGSGSYKLVKQNHPKNNDPMIVLDGTSYVTFYQKDPWR